jgi:hypothetical protein
MLSLLVFIAIAGTGHADTKPAAKPKVDPIAADFVLRFTQQAMLGAGPSSGVASRVTSRSATRQVKKMVHSALTRDERLPGGVEQTLDPHGNFPVITQVAPDTHIVRSVNHYGSSTTVTPVGTQGRTYTSKRTVVPGEPTLIHDEYQLGRKGASREVRAAMEVLRKEGTPVTGNAVPREGDEVHVTRTWHDKSGERVDLISVWRPNVGGLFQAQRNRGTQVDRSKPSPE